MKQNVLKVILLIAIILCIFFLKVDLVKFVQFLKIKNFYTEREPKNKSDIEMLYSRNDEKYQYYITSKYTGEGEINYTLFIFENLKFIGNYDFSLPQSPIFSTFYFELDNKTIIFGDLKTKGWDTNSNEIEGNLNKIEFYDKNIQISSFDLEREQKFYFFIINGLNNIDFVKVYENDKIVSDSNDGSLKKIDIKNWYLCYYMSVKTMSLY